MEKFEFEDEIYYFHKGQFYDEKFMALDQIQSDRIAHDYFKRFDYKKMEAKELLFYIKAFKDASQFTLAKDAGLYGLEAFHSKSEFIRQALPMITSVYRQLNLPEEGLKLAENYLDQYGGIYRSVALLTSLAAACCDIKNYKSAKKYADKAYAIQGGGLGYKSELSLVYNRIRKESGLNE